MKTLVAERGVAVRRVEPALRFAPMGKLGAVLREVLREVPRKLRGAKQAAACSLTRLRSLSVVAHEDGLMIGARTFPGNPYDGHILSTQLEQTNILLEDIGVKPKQVIVDLGFRGVDDDAIHAVLCAAGYNLRRLMRAIVRGRIKPLFLRLRIGWCWAVITAAPALSRPKRNFAQKAIVAQSPWLQ